MASLMDKINQGLTSSPTQATTSQAGIEKILKAKSGKAGGGASVPAASSLAAETATAQAQSELRQGAFRGALAGAEMQQKSEQIAEREKLGKQKLESKGRMFRSGLQASERIAADRRAANEEQARAQRSSQENMQLDRMEAGATQALRDLATQRGITIDNIFGDFDRSNKELEFRKDAAELEQLGFQLAMSDRAYTDELNRIGRERLLSNDLHFSEESARITLGDNLTDVLTEHDWLRSFNGDKRAWGQELGQMNINHITSMAEAAIADANQSAMINGLVSVGKAGWKAYGADIEQYGKDKWTEWTAPSMDDYSGSDTYQSGTNTGNDYSNLS